MGAPHAAIMAYLVMQLMLVCLLPSGVSSMESGVETDGGWGLWGRWSGCSLTCGDGRQTRKRACADPVPTPGGKQCQGEAVETKSCADWHCPDCEAAPDCPRGGTPDSACSLCWCDPDDVITGKVRERNFYPRTYLSGVDVFVRGRDWEPVGVTDCDGAFTIRGLCHEGTALMFSRPGYVAEHFLYQVGLSSSNVRDLGEIIMYEESAPRIFKDPESTPVVEGGGVNLICHAGGRPSVTKFTWLKDGKQFTKGEQTDSKDRTSGNAVTTLLISDLTVADSGDYQCVAASSAGSTRSKPGSVMVYKGSGVGSDNGGTCSSGLSPKYVQLHQSCTATVDGQEVTSVNVRACPRNPCPYIPEPGNGPTPANGPTGPWVGCCGPSEISPVDVTCDGGVSYQLFRVEACNCHVRMPDQNPGVLIEGVLRVIKMRDGQQTWETVPKFHFNIFGGDVQDSVTAMDTGAFALTILPSGNTVTLQFATNFNNKNFFPHVVVIRLQEGVHNYRTIVNLRERPPSVNISVRDLTEGHTLSLPTPVKGNSPGTVTPPSTGVLDRWGEPLDDQYQVNIFLDFADPRHPEDFAMSPGDMLYDADGEPRYLKTYGLLWLQMEQRREVINGHCPGEVRLMATEINLPHPVKSCTLNPMLWALGTGKGMSQWKPWAKLEKIAVCDMVAYGEKAVSKYLSDPAPHRYNNPSLWRRGRLAEGAPTFLWDRPALNIAEVIPNGQLCEISVYVFRGPSQQAFPGEQVVVYSKKLHSERLLSFQSVFTGVDGKACLVVPCGYRHTVTVWSMYGATASPTHHLWSGFIFQNADDGKSVEITSPKPKDVSPVHNGRTGPVHRYAHHTCPGSDGDDYHLSFYAESAPAPDYLTAVQLETNQLLSWHDGYVESEWKLNHPDACFLRVAVQTTERQSIQVVATSRYGEEAGGDILGTYTAGLHLIQDVETGRPRLVDNFACVQVKCPGDVKDEMGQVHRDVPTRVDLKVLAPSGNSCRLRWIAEYLVSPTSSREDGGRILPLNIRASSDTSLDLVLNSVSFSDMYDMEYRMPGFYRDSDGQHSSPTYNVRQHCIADDRASVALFDCEDGLGGTEWWDGRTPPGFHWELNLDSSED